MKRVGNAALCGVWLLLAGGVVGCPLATGTLDANVTDGGTDRGDPTHFTCYDRLCTAGRETCSISPTVSGVPLAICAPTTCPEMLDTRCASGYACERAANCGPGEVCCGSFGPARVANPIDDAGCVDQIIDGGGDVAYSPAWQCVNEPRRACTHAAQCPPPAPFPVDLCCGPGGPVLPESAACVTAAYCPRDALRCAIDADCPADVPHCQVVGTFFGGWDLRMCRP